MKIFKGYAKSIFKKKSIVPYTILVLCNHSERRRRKALGDRITKNAMDCLGDRITKKLDPL